MKRVKSPHLSLGELKPGGSITAVTAQSTTQPGLDKS